jgi:hypothetical protein
LIPSEDTSALAAELLKQYGLRAEGDHLAARASIIQRYGLAAVLARYAALFGGKLQHQTQPVNSV